jgi:hypothetical protein
MAEKEELNPILMKQREIKENISPFINETKNLADSLVALLTKEPFLEADLDKAFELIDAIQEQNNEINALLFDIRDTIK